MKHLVLIHVDEGFSGPPSDGLMEAMVDYVKDNPHATLVTDGGLAQSSSAIRMTSRDGKVTTTDGPFAEAKEVVGGFMLIDAATPEDAAAWMRGFVDLHADHWPELPVVTELREIAGSLSD